MPKAWTIILIFFFLFVLIVTAMNVAAQVSDERFERLQQQVIQNRVDFAAHSGSSGHEEMITRVTKIEDAYLEVAKTVGGMERAGTMALGIIGGLQGIGTLFLWVIGRRLIPPRQPPLAQHTPVQAP